MKKSHNSLFLGFGLLTALVATVLVTTGGVFSNGFLIRATSTTIEDGTITFDGANTTRSSYTYTTPSKTAGGNYIKAVGTNNGLNDSGVVASFGYSDSELHFRDSSNNEFGFSGSVLKQISLTKNEYNAFYIKYAYKCSGDIAFTVSDEINLTQAKTHTINLGNLEDVCEFKIVRSGSYSGLISKVVITYDCGPGVSRTLSDLDITTVPTKTTYYDGESFSSTGMVITATYSNGDMADVTSSCTFDKTTLTTSDTKVTASYTYKGTTLTVEQSITVNPVVVTSISLDEAEKEINVGESFTLVATILPSNATDKTISWSTSDSTVATINNGVVTGIGEGAATITATTNDGGYSASCSVTVTDSSTVLTGTYNYAGRGNNSYFDWSQYNMTITFSSDGTCLWRNVHSRGSTIYETKNYDAKVNLTYILGSSEDDITISMSFVSYDFKLNGNTSTSASAFSGGSTDRPLKGGFAAGSQNVSGVLTQNKQTLTIDVYEYVSLTKTYEKYDTFTFTLAQ